MFEQDYILRLIHEVIRMAIKLLCGEDIDEPGPEILETREERDRLNDLLKLVDDGFIDQAENALFDLLIPNDSPSLKTALLFYSYLGKKDDRFLEAHDFSREEIAEGLKDALSQWGAPEIAEMLTL